MSDELKKYLTEGGRATVSRRQFLKLVGLGLATMLIPPKIIRTALAKSETRLEPRKRRAVKTPFDLVMAKGADPATNTRKAVEALGGISRFVKEGDVVVVKPNIGWDRAPEQAATTEPAVVETLVKMCVEAGAKTVKVFDNTCNNAKRCYQNSGIRDAAKRAGAQVAFVDKWRFFPGKFPEGSALEDWPLYRDAAECDCLINAPVAKHHGLTRLTLSLKNLMGACGGNRGRIHWDIDQKLAELALFLKPDLTVIDATRILLRHGPQGGNLEDVEPKNTVIAGADPVLADACACSLFGLKPTDIGHIRKAAEMGVGSLDIAKAKVKEIKT
ncbi:MAG: DUF362 domain-containing protein [Candidatus Edwardsbacteria bacterium]|nr:DUF362 domain-containing protein [Candidatus Edwardsbacteria bacterium]